VESGKDDVNPQQAARRCHAQRLAVVPPDTVAADFEPKPALIGYRLLLKRHAVRPETALMVEDMARNLAPAAELGMTTAWLRNRVDWAMEWADSEYIHHVVEEPAGFLAAAAALQSPDRTKR
jgi:putative hydrolase of the HAD superfamily